MSKMLDGIKVLDITNVYAGPVSAACMADFGADVIHVEKPVLGDDSRSFPPLTGTGASYGFWANNRGKKSVVIDMKDEQGRELIKKMAADADVMIESFRPGVMDRLGLGYEDIKAVNHDIVYCSVSAFGQKGPYSDRPGYDVIAQAYSGFMHMTGEENGPPMKTGIIIADAVTALVAYGSIVTALLYRDRTGIGQHVDCALARSMLYVNSAFDRINVGIDKQRYGNLDNGLMPYGLFEGKNDESIILAVLSVKLWEKFCAVAEHPEWITDERFLTVDKRVENKDVLTPLICDWLRSFDKIEDAAEILTRAGIPNTKVNTHTDIANDRQARECEWIIEGPAEDGAPNATYLTRGVMASFSEAPGDPYHRPPKFGENNYEVLSQYGLSRAEISALEAKWSKK